MQSGFYRAVWRWHFYAGLIVLPVLAWMAVTGGLYLYNDEIDRAIYSDWIVLEGPAVPMPADAMVARVAAERGGAVTQLSRPAAARESWRMIVEKPDGARETVFVHPEDGRVLGVTSEGGVTQTVRSLHSLAITGAGGRMLVEIVAGWAIILVASGFYLWWPRRGQKALALRGRPRERRFWRDFHASTGAVVGAAILFLAVTGLPWSFFWGARLQEAIAGADAGRPVMPTAQTAQTAQTATQHERHAGHEEHEGHMPWSLQAAEPPPVAGTGDVGVSGVLTVAAERRLAPPYVLNLPRKAGAPYSVSLVRDDATQMRLLYVEPASGRVLQDVGHADFGAGAQWVEWGIYTHQGHQYGEINRIVMLIGCVGVLLFAISAPILWWKRRRKGRVDAPPPGDKRQARVVAAMMVVGGLLLPLTGLTMLTAWLGELAWRRLRPSSNAA